MSDSAPPPRRVPIIGKISADEVVTFNETPSAREFLERARQAPPADGAADNEP